MTLGRAAANASTIRAIDQVVAPSLEDQRRHGHDGGTRVVLVRVLVERVAERAPAGRRRDGTLPVVPVSRQRRRPSSASPGNVLQSSTRAGASSTSRSTARVPRRSARAATCHATNAPRLDPISTTGPGGNAAIAVSTWPIMRVVVSVSKAGSLKSGACSVERASAARARCAPEVDVLAFAAACGDDAKPMQGCRRRLQRS